ncbi:glutathione S-transferase family protein [Alloalcanivorax xenomutans]|jgi:glutathione S-transferase|uniref:glutathione S-transferase family protein n=1 Tax=Alloalcanivorax xenomutans TaxID=1094342 RepID=UPI0006D5BB64|nr:glutathione S-transferase family protein [Alloalcanivorax xenomutans]MBA4721546.1 glutathione S-transferase family protein [Alcanivorax sp.]PHS60542.1 MAG: glutathione S-transferase family protein [Alcanivorax sp.]WOA32708.1 glutathione S-transferase family protein [Alloalcanivorax xenomutans]CUR45260.1 Glutathione S-transferase, unnamed subgroup [Alloalcanivorax xenomutans]
MILYDDPISGNGYKIRLLLALLGIPYQYVPVDILRGESRTPEFLARNPNGRIPVLQLDDGTFLPESNAALFYLSQGTDYWPGDKVEQAQVMQWLFFEQYSHEPNIATARFWLAIKGLEETPFNRQLLEQKHKAGNEALAVMDRHLSTRTFMVGERYSIADIALYAYTHEAHEGGFDLSLYPHVQAWLDRVCGQPGHVTIEQVPKA